MTKAAAKPMYGKTPLKSSKTERSNTFLHVASVIGVLAGDQWWPFFVTFYFLVTDILCLVIQYFGSIN